MSEIHPNIDFDRLGKSQTVRSDDAEYGVHRFHQRESYIRCKKCGFCFDKSKVTKPHMVGTTFTTDYYLLDTIGWGQDVWGGRWGGGTVQYYGDPTVNNSCPFCGSNNYD